MKTKSTTDMKNINNNGIEEVLKLIQSDEVRELLREWLAQCRDPVYAYTEIITHAPIPLEQKVSLIKLFEEQYDGIVECNVIEYALSDRYEHYDRKNPARTEFRLYMYNQYSEEFERFSTFDDAAEHIKQARGQQGSAVSDNKVHESWKYGKVNKVEKWIPDNRGVLRLHMYWFLNDAGEILYHQSPEDPTRSDPWVIPGRLTFPVPFQPGDIVATDCSPFAEQRKVLILENNDTLDSVDGQGVTCLFINEDNKIDVGYFKLNEFLRYPRHTYVSALHRAKLFNGELTGAEAPLGIIGTCIKENPKLGREIFVYVSQHKLSFAIASGDNYKAEDFSGFSWKALQRSFNLISK